MPDARPSAERWRAAVDLVKARVPRLGKSLAYGRVVAVRPGEVELAFPKEADFHRAMVTGNGRPQVEAALQEFFQRPTRLLVSNGPLPTAPSVAEAEVQARTQREQSIESKVRAHPAVRQVLTTLGGELEHVQVLDEPQQPPAGSPADGSDERA